VQRSTSSGGGAAASGGGGGGAREKRGARKPRPGRRPRPGANAALLNSDAVAAASDLAKGFDVKSYSTGGAGRVARHAAAASVPTRSSNFMY
jgi:hypothetical protein